MERLTVTRFGPIKKAEIELRKYTVLVGYTSAGKSTIAKLVCIFNSINLYRITPSTEVKAFYLLLKEYSIDFAFEQDTEITYCNNAVWWRISASGIETNFEYSALVTQLSNFKGFNETVLTLLKEAGVKEPAIQTILDRSGFAAQDEQKDSEQTWNTPFLRNFLVRRVLDLIVKRRQPVYIPAERNLLSIVDSNMFGLALENVVIPPILMKFGALYDMSKRRVGSKIKLPSLKSKIEFGDTNNDDYIVLNNRKRINLSLGSSGYQSLVPLWTVFTGSTAPRRNIFVIEEPELNLFPTTQKDLIISLVEEIYRSPRSIIVTTHSPYVIATFNNLIQAGNVAKKIGDEKGEKAARLNRIIPAERRIDFDDIRCYYFNASGNVKKAMSEQKRMLKTEVIDDVSEVLAAEFDELLSIKYEL